MTKRGNYTWGIDEVHNALLNSDSLVNGREVT